MCVHFPDCAINKKRMSITLPPSFLIDLENTICAEVVRTKVSLRELIYIYTTIIQCYFAGPGYFTFLILDNDSGCFTINTNTSLIISPGFPMYRGNTYCQEAFSTLLLRVVQSCYYAMSYLNRDMAVKGPFSPLIQMAVP